MQTIQISLHILALLIVLALLFDFMNGFHDAANAIATVVSTGVLRPQTAVAMAAFFNLAAVFVFHQLHVAASVGKGTIEPAIVDQYVIFGALIGAIFWNLITWWFGIPSSSSHALVGGLAGAVVIAVGADHVIWGFSQLSQGHFTGVTKVLLALIISPLIGFWAGFFIHRLVFFLMRGAKPGVNKFFKRIQLVSCAGLAFAHGANDAQKSMGIITLVLVNGGILTAFEVPFWVILACATAITLGILSGGWRIVRTVGFGIFKVRPIHAFDAQLTSASVIFTASMIGAPVSTTHVVSSALMGIGASERPKAVRWAKAQEIVSTWIITIPGAGTVSVLTYLLVNALVSVN